MTPERTLSLPLITSIVALTNRLILQLDCLLFTVMYASCLVELKLELDTEINEGVRESFKNEEPLVVEFVAAK